MRCSSKSEDGSAIKYPGSEGRLKRERERFLSDPWKQIRRFYDGGRSFNVIS